MRLPILSNLFKNHQNQLFGQTRWRLTMWYAGMMGAVLGLCGWGTYNALAYAYRLAITQELDLVANELHQTLEPILEQPGQLTAAVTKIFPDLCLVNTQCVGVAPEAKKSNFQSSKYQISFFNSEGNLVAVMGNKQSDLLESEQNSYQQVSVELHTKDFQVWGVLKVRDTSPKYAVMIANLRWIFILGLPTLIIILILISWWLAGKAMQPVRQSYQLLQEFTADAAHELRTPLAAIRATVESTLMMSKITEIESKETLITIARQNVRLSNLVADLLMLCRMDKQLSSISALKVKELVLIDNLAQDIVEDFSSLAVKLKIQLDIKLLVKEPLAITGNYEQLYRMISNLVANALQYTVAGGIVKLILNRRGKYALLKIKDTGVGISQPELEKIFTRFYRVNSDRSRDTGGSGLGLSIAQAIAKAHQGTILVKSQLGQGSTFTISLPLEKSSLV
jgi:signal transduction histidine kinase